MGCLARASSRPPWVLWSLLRTLTLLGPFLFQCIELCSPRMGCVSWILHTCWWTQHRAEGLTGFNTVC